MQAKKYENSKNDEKTVKYNNKIQDLCFLFHHIEFPTRKKIFIHIFLKFKIHLNQSYFKIFID